MLFNNEFLSEIICLLLKLLKTFVYSNLPEGKSIWCTKVGWSLNWTRVKYTHCSLSTSIWAGLIDALAVWKQKIIKCYSLYRGVEKGLMRYL